jgi:hypothetical protein
MQFARRLCLSLTRSEDDLGGVWELLGASRCSAPPATGESWARNDATDSSPLVREISPRMAFQPNSVGLKVWKELRGGGPTEPGGESPCRTMAMMVDVEGPSRPVLRPRNRPLRPVAAFRCGCSTSVLCRQRFRLSPTGRGRVTSVRDRTPDRGSSGGWNGCRVGALLRTHSITGSRGRLSSESIRRPTGCRAPTSALSKTGHKWNEARHDQLSRCKRRERDG